VPLGEVHMAFRLVGTMRDLTFTALWRLMLPAMSARQHDLVALRQVADRCLGLSALVVLPLLGAMAMVVGPLTVWLLGSAWAASGAAALPLIALTAWLFLWFPSGAALIARGVPRPALTANCAAMVVMLVGVVVVRPATPGQAIAVWLAAQLVTSPYTIRQTSHMLGTGLVRSLRAGLPAMAATLAAVACGVLLPTVFGPPSNQATLIVARLAAATPVGLLGLGLCVLHLGLLGNVPGFVPQRHLKS
jgi:O-antigen/teichoic acid export membrane protein